MSAALPLAGLRVVEFVHMVMGPACGLVLADLGAEVIKVESVEGDSTRSLPGSGAGYWPTYNRNKQSLAVDLKSPQGREVVERLIASADIVTENFRPGAMEKLGLGPEVLRARHPRLIYCAMKGFLPGPYEQRTALDEVVQMMGGLAYMTGPEGRPLRAGASVNDVMGGLFAVIGILAAVVERQHTGQGKLVQAGLFENNVFLVAQHMLQYAVTGRPAPPMPSRLSAWAVYDVFATRDADQVFIGVVSDAQWLAFCKAFDLARLVADPELATNAKRVRARDSFMPALREHLAGFDKAEVMRRCEAAGLPHAPIQRPEDLFGDAHLLQSDGFTEITLPDGRVSAVPALPIALDGVRTQTRSDLPGVGEHTHGLLVSLGYTQNDIREMLAAGCVAAPDSNRA